MHITTKVVSLNHAHGEVYLIQHQCSSKTFLTARHLGQWLAKVTRTNQCTLDRRYFYFPAPFLSLNCFLQYVQYIICSSYRSQGRSMVQWSLKDSDLYCSYCFLACDTSSGVLEGFFNFFPGIASSCHLKSMLIYRNHKQLKTNTSHNDRALSVTIRTGQSGKKILIFFIFTHKK